MKNLPGYLMASLAASAVLMAPGAAYADTNTVGDAVGDVRHSRYDANSANPHPETAVYRDASRKESDIQWYRTVHGSYAVRLRVHFRELKRVGFKSFAFAVVGSNGKAVRSYVVATAGIWSGATYVGDPREGIPDTRFTFRIDYDTNNFYVTIPRTVLGNPEWVRSSFQMATSFDRPENSNLSDNYIDTANRGYTKTLPAGRVFGPKVFQ